DCGTRGAFVRERNCTVRISPSTPWLLLTTVVTTMAACLFLAGCGDDDALTENTIPTSVTPTPVASCDDPAVRANEPLCALDTQTVPCDFLIEAKCLLPYPSAFFLTPDSTTPTGWRVNYPPEGMPANRAGVHIDPTEWNTLDGFSPGPIIEALFPQGVDLPASRVPSITDLSRSLDADSPTVLIDAASGARGPHFAELDAQATSAATQTFMIRPAVRLHEATRYIVAIRGLRDLQGATIAPGRAFQMLRDGVTSPVRVIEARRTHFEDIFATLTRAGVALQDLILAWDFVTTSTQSLTTGALAVRDQGLAANGPGAPPFTVTAVQDNYSDRIFRRVRGTYTVPLFTTSAQPPTTLNLDSEGVPRQNGTATAPFTVTIPRSAVEGAAPVPGRPIVYGHGLLGSGEDEVTANNLQTLSNHFGFILGATDWVGMASEDLETVMRVIPDLSNFRRLPDRLQQAMLNFILLGRLLSAPDGFNSHPAFQFNGVPIIDTRELYYYGISQGGIEGGAYLALSPDTHRGVL